MQFENPYAAASSADKESSTAKKTAKAAVVASALAMGGNVLAQENQPMHIDAEGDNVEMVSDHNQSPDSVKMKDWLENGIPNENPYYALPDRDTFDSVESIVGEINALDEYLVQLTENINDAEDMSRLQQMIRSAIDAFSVLRKSEDEASDMSHLELLLDGNFNKEKASAIIDIIRGGINRMSSTLERGRNKQREQEKQDSGLMHVSQSLEDGGSTISGRDVEISDDQEEEMGSEKITEQDLEKLDQAADGVRNLMRGFFEGFSGIANEYTSPQERQDLKKGAEAMDRFFGVFTETIKDAARLGHELQEKGEGVEEETKSGNENFEDDESELGSEAPEDKIDQGGSEGMSLERALSDVEQAEAHIESGDLEKAQELLQDSVNVLRDHLDDENNLVIMKIQGDIDTGSSTSLNLAADILQTLLNRNLRQESPDPAESMPDQISV